MHRPHREPSAYCPASSHKVNAQVNTMATERTADVHRASESIDNSANTQERCGAACTTVVQGFLPRARYRTCSSGCRWHNARVTQHNSAKRSTPPGRHKHRSWATTHLVKDHSLAAHLAQHLKVQVANVRYRHMRHSQGGMSRYPACRRWTHVLSV